MRFFLMVAQNPARFPIAQIGVIMTLAKSQQERINRPDTKNQQLAQVRIELQNFNQNVALPNLYKIISLFKAFVNPWRNTSVIQFL
ncbi:MAG: hypothetical protein M3O33_16105 [Cyanobacteriota bacterium]|nr:hypothetical protein [Cyanobacteriota bacterium]